MQSSKAPQSPTWIGIISIILPSLIFVMNPQKLWTQSLPKKIKLPSKLIEVSGLYLAGSDSLWWHNDSGDRPSLFLTDRTGRLLNEIRVEGAQNVDWEDLTYDDEGWLYIGDFGDNRLRRTSLQIYKYHPPSGRLDSIVFNYEAPDKSGRSVPYNAEAFFWHKDSLYIFTKDLLPKGQYITRQYVLADDLPRQTARFQDSLKLRRRVVTAAAIHAESQSVVLCTYTYRRILGFIPYSAASLYFFSEYPGELFLRGRSQRKNIAAFIPTQFEAIDFIDENTVYVASERTPLYKQKAKKKKRKNNRRNGSF